MSKYKALTELAESSGDVNVKIANNMKYYETLNKESM